MPLNNIIILESSPDYSDSAYALFEYFLSKGVNKKYKIVWYLNKNFTDYPKYHNVEYVYRHSDDRASVLKRLYYENTAKFIFDGNVFIYKQRKDQVRIHLTHGDPYKVAYEYTSLIGDANGILTSSSYFIDFYTWCTKCKKEEVLPLGLPRNTVFNENRPYDKNTIIWMPTYRKHSNGYGMEEAFGNFFNGMPAVHSEEEFNALIKTLKEKNVTLYYRAHPAQDMSDFKLKKYDNFVIADDDFLRSKNIKLYDFIAGCGGLITDYSSIYNDFLLTGRPIGLTVEDYVAYKEKFDIVFEEPKEFVKGDYIYNNEELCEFIRNFADGVDNSKKERLEANAKLHDLVDCNYSEVLYNYMVEKYKL